MPGIQSKPHLSLRSSRRLAKFADATRLWGSKMTGGDLSFSSGFVKARCLSPVAKVLASSSLEAENRTWGRAEAPSQQTRGMEGAWE